MQRKVSEKHPLNSPIWEVEITGIEVFYPGERVESPLSHALLVRVPRPATEWGSINHVYIPGTTEIWPLYSTADIKHMVEIPLGPTTAYSSPRVSGRHIKHDKVDKAIVPSVRVCYNKREMFLDRYGSLWQNKGDRVLVLSTAQILAILSFT
jgi:hypothetical protein